MHIYPGTSVCLTWTSVAMATATDAALHSLITLIVTEVMMVTGREDIQYEANDERLHGGWWLSKVHLSLWVALS